MLNVTLENKEGVSVIHLEGRLDSSNANAFEYKIPEVPEDNNVEIDLKNLEYISSAGLRVILSMKKIFKNLSVRNASTEVYEILDMTGFTQIMDVTRAYRRISVEGCEVIGQGANGKVYRIDPDTVVKTYMNPDSLEWIINEREMAKKAFVLGIPTAISYDIVEVGDYYASMFEMVNSKSIAKRLRENPDSVDENAEIYVNLIKLVHSTEVPEGQVPKKKVEALSWAEYVQDYLPADVGAKIKDLFEKIPDDNHMIHGDYHIKNVMVERGEATLIDMDTLGTGHPVLEMAAVYNAYEGFYLADDKSVNFETFMGVDYNTIQKFYRKSLELYYGTDDDEVIEKMKNKAKLVGLTRLYRRCISHKEPEEKIRIYKDELIATAAKVDSLT